METAVTGLLNAIVAVKGMYDQHTENKEEIEEVRAFLEEYREQIPALRNRFRECEPGNNLGGAALKLLEADISQVTKKLTKYAKNGSFFSIFTSRERMQELQKLHRNVMASVQKNVGIASLSLLLDVRERQAEIHGGILRSTSELKCLVTTSMARMSSEVARKVRAEVVQASHTSFVENEKFWADVLAAVDNSQLAKSSSSSSDQLLADKTSICNLDDRSNEQDPPAYVQVYMDPITDELMIDPVNTSNGETFNRWTIIDHNLTKDPLNPSGELQILGDNISVRRALFDDFPEQLAKFRQRRDDYRREALSLAKKNRFADAVMALQYVLQWDKDDKECGGALSRAREALKEALEAQQLDAREELHEKNSNHQTAKVEEITVEPVPDHEPGTIKPLNADVSAGDKHKFQRTRFADSEHSDEIWIVGDDPADRHQVHPVSKNITMNVVDFGPMKAGRKIQKAHSGWVESVNYSPDGRRIATTGFDKTAKVWDAVSGKMMVRLEGHKYLVRSCAWSPRGNELATGSYDHTTKVWDAKSGEMLYSLKGHVDRVSSVAWNPRGHMLATGSDDGSAILWDVRSRDAVSTLSADSGHVSSVAWSPSGDLLAVGYVLASMRVWDIADSNKVLFELKCASSAKFHSVTWSPDESELAAASSNYSTVVCDARWGDVRLTLRGHTDEVVAVAWSPDGTRIATASKDKTAMVWNADSGERLFTLRGHSSSLSSLAWRRDGHGLATASEGGSVIIWECPRGQPAAHSKAPAAPRLSKLFSFKSQG